MLCQILMIRDNTTSYTHYVHLKLKRKTSADMYIYCGRLYSSRLQLLR